MKRPTLQHPRTAARRLATERDARLVLFTAGALAGLTPEKRRALGSDELVAEHALLMGETTEEQWQKRHRGTKRDAT